MERREALVRLGLDETASRADINAAWRGIVRNVHPDSGVNPDRRVFERVTEARDAALQSLLVGAGTDLIPRSILPNLVSAQTEAVAAAGVIAEAEMKRLVLHHVGRLRSVKNRRSKLARLAAVIGAAVTVSGANQGVSDLVGASYAIEPFLVAFGATMLFLSAVLGLLAAQAGAMEADLSDQLKNVGVTLSDRSTVDATLSEIGVGMFFTMHELTNRIEDWIGSAPIADVYRPGVLPSLALSLSSRPNPAVPLVYTAGKIGITDFRGLLVAKAKELQMLVDDVWNTPEGRVFGFSRT